MDPWIWQSLDGNSFLISDCLCSIVHVAHCRRGAEGLEEPEEQGVGCEIVF